MWLFTLARNRCRNRLRDERRRGRWTAGAADDGPDVAARSATAAPDQLERLLAAERERQVRAALLELPPKLREAVLLRFDQGLEYADIARIIGRPEVTVRSRVHLAMKRLRTTLGEEPTP